MSASQAAGFERCMSVGGIAVFPADTVYGLACDAQDRLAVEQLYRLKRRSLRKPSAVMFFDLELALTTLPELGPRTAAAFERLLPGPVTVLLANPQRRFPLACGADQLTLGLRVPAASQLQGVKWPVLQSSANLAGGPEPRRLEDVPEPIRRRADMLIDGGELPGTASTVVDLRRYEAAGSWAVVRPGAMDEPALAAALDWQFHFDPTTYAGMIREDIQVYDRFQDELAEASGVGARRVLELGTGTGETAARLLARHPQAELIGVDESPEMLTAARSRLPKDRVALQVARLQDALPPGPFDLVASALCVHHLNGPEKRDLFTRIRAALRPGGRFVLADVVVPPRANDAITSLTPGFDHPNSLAEQLEWLSGAGFAARVTWQYADLAVVVADAAATTPRL